jgi:hypothetical protein
MAKDEQQDVETFPMGVVLQRFRSNVDTGRKGRKARHLTVSGAIDKRSLRATGRTEQMNFKVTKEIRDALAKHVGRGKMSLWLEQAIVAKLKDEGVDLG